jgi:hypothetical protein
MSERRTRSKIVSELCIIKNTAEGILIVETNSHLCKNHIYFFASIHSLYIFPNENDGCFRGRDCHKPINYPDDYLVSSLR